MIVPSSTLSTVVIADGEHDEPPPSERQPLAVLRCSELAARPGEGFAAGDVGARIDRRIAVDERAAEQRMTQAAHFVLEPEVRRVRRRAPTMSRKRYSCALFSAVIKLAFEQLAVRRRKVGDVDLDVVAVVGRERRVGFAEDQFLPAGAHVRGAAAVDASPARR